jgi:hypothetical protein
MSRLVHTFALCALCALATALAFAGDPGTDLLGSLAASDGKCKPRLQNSRAGEAILAMSDMEPGDETRGSVKIANTGCGKARLALRTQLREQPGPAGWLLSRALTVRITESGSGDGKRSRRTRKVYSGALLYLTGIPLGKLAPGEAHRYSFSVGLRESDESAVPGFDNRYQGAEAQVRFLWRLNP